MIRPTDLRKDWSWVRTLLETIKEKTSEQWLPEDIYSAVKTGVLAMFVSDEPKGMLVVELGKDKWTAEPILHVWALALDGPSDELIDEGYELLQALGRKNGAKRMTMESPRRGWQRKGWNVTRYFYERAL